MLQTFHEGVGHAFLHLVAVVVAGMVVDIEYRLVHLAHAMSEQIDGHHWNGKPPVCVLAHVLLVVVLQGKVAAETERLGGQPCLLKLDEHKVWAAALVEDGGGKVDAEHGNSLPAREVGIFVTAYFYVDYFLFEQCRKNGLGDAVVFHDILEDGIVERICNIYNHNLILRVSCCD